ncbi:MAG: hypothetical protein NT019_00465 [Candidatus Adlerbacteria bacterium]|nr:hypothetical protein [Candidatus Adlerbacteria bacterium]
MMKKFLIGLGFFLPVLTIGIVAHKEKQELFCPVTPSQDKETEKQTQGKSTEKIYYVWCGGVY